MTVESKPKTRLGVPINKGWHTALKFIKENDDDAIDLTLEAFVRGLIEKNRAEFESEVPAADPCRSKIFMFKDTHSKLKELQLFLSQKLGFSMTLKSTMEYLISREILNNWDKIDDKEIRNEFLFFAEPKAK